MKLCQRKPVCATEYMLPWDNTHVMEHLKQLRAMRTRKGDKGFNVVSAMKEAGRHGIAWDTFRDSTWPLLAGSPWSNLLCRRQQAALCFNMSAYPDDNIVFRKIDCNFRRGAIVERNEDGRCIIPFSIRQFRQHSAMFFFDGTAIPRLVLGRELLALQGFLAKRLEEPEVFKFGEFDLGRCRKKMFW